MKNKLRVLLLFIFMTIVSDNSKADGIDVNIALSDGTGGGSSSLNSIEKPKDKGDVKSGSGNKIDYIIEHSYKITESKNKSLKLLVTLIMKRSGKKDNSYNVEIGIEKDGTQVFKPFEGITMQVNSKGFTTKSQ